MGASADVRLTERKDIAVARHMGYESDSCANCGNYTLVRNGERLKCDSCGSAFPEAEDDHRTLTLGAGGQIDTVTRSGQTGIVLLDEPCQGFTLAAIDYHTIGRDALIQLSPDGVLVRGTKVRVMRAFPSNECLVAVEVEYAGE